MCAVVVFAVASSTNAYILGDPFIAKYPALFTGKGVIGTTLPRGVPLNAGQALGNSGGPEEDICFFGTVPVSFSHVSLSCGEHVYLHCASSRSQAGTCEHVMLLVLLAVPADN